MKFTTACIQTNSQDNEAANIDAAIDQIKTAHARGAQFITLPENVFYMDAPGVKLDPASFHDQSQHPGVLACEDIARRLKVWVLIGSVALKIDESGKRSNRSLLIDDRGTIVAHYDKVHLFDVDLGDGEKYNESARFLHGGAATVANLPWTKIGMSVCYDLRFPHLYRMLAKAGAELLTVPAAFAAITGRAHWHVLQRARAIENGCFVIAPAQCGVHPGGRETFGHSLIVDPWGTVLADGGEQTGIIMAEIDTDKVSQVRRKIPCLQHDREISGC